MMFDERVEEVPNIPSHHHECNVIRSENELPGPVHMPQAGNELHSSQPGANPVGETGSRAIQKIAYPPQLGGFEAAHA
jgi:hypothetical protein